MVKIEIELTEDGAAHRVWSRLLAQNDQLITASYVLVETIALMQRRLGFAAVDVLRADFEPTVWILRVGEALHEAGVAIWARERRRDLSLVDCVSFAAISQGALEAVFAFDPHFSDQGFRVLA